MNDQTILLQVAAVFGTGVLASLSPCVYPMLPITLGFFSGQGNGRSRAQIISYASGMAVALSVLGVVAVSLGETFGFSSQNRGVEISVGAALLLFAFLSWRGTSLNLLTGWNGFIGRATQRSENGLAVAFLLGGGAALMTSPCTSPILGGVLSLMASSSSFTIGILLMATYSTGFSIVFLLVGLGLVKLTRLPKAGRWMKCTHALGSLLLVLVGLYYLLPPSWKGY